MGAAQGPTQATISPPIGSPLQRRTINTQTLVVPTYLPKLTPHLYFNDFLGVTKTAYFNEEHVAFDHIEKSPRHFYLTIRLLETKRQGKENNGSKPLTPEGPSTRPCRT